MKKVQEVGVLETVESSQKTQGSREEGRKEMFYLTMHSTHFIYGYVAAGHLVKGLSRVSNCNKFENCRLITNRHYWV